MRKKLRTDRHERSKQYFDRNTKELKPLKSGDTVHVKIGKNWKPALLLPDDSDKSNYRSYKIQLPSGKITRRNRRHLLRTSEENIYQRNPDEDEDISLREQKQFSEEQALPEQFIGNPDVDIPSVEPATPSGKP